MEVIMSKLSKGFRYSLLILSSILVSSISWASSEMGGISALFASMTTGSIQAACTNPYTACSHSDTCPRWTKICKLCINYNPVQYCGEVMPIIPDSINISVDNPTTVTITWRPVLNATSYTIYIGDNPTSLNQLSKTIQPKYTYPYLDADHNYYFALTATNSAGTSAKSEPRSVVTSILVAPHYTAPLIDNYKDISVEAYLPNGKLSGTFRATIASSVTNQLIAEKLNLKTGTFEILIKDRTSGKLLESKTLTMMN
jgi:hypothetical protein